MKGMKREVAKMRTALGAMLPLGVLGYSVTLPPPTTYKVDFARDIQPIIKDHCAKCHSGSDAAAGLSLDSVARILKGGVSGKAAIPLQSRQSLILDRIEGKGGKPQMPLAMPALTKTEIDLIAQWIDQGCYDSTGGKPKLHWAYVKPVKPPTPALNSPWITNPIDAFVLQRLHKEGLNPSPEADRTTLIRRLTLDLTGLPPTPEEVDSFIADKSPNAYEKLVDRLFASPHYGERMALPWLDAARYADSNGFQMDGDTYQYVWRDWVIRAMNANMPFDEFTVEQIAGDLLPHPTQDQLVATAFNRNHMLNGEGGAIPEEQRSVSLFDRVDTTSTTWLGLTMTCARCHDHKYDPLKQRDYYSLMAFFNNVPETGAPTENDGRHFIAAPWIYAGSKEQMANAGAIQTDLNKAKEAAKPYEQGPGVDAEQASWEASIKSVPGKTPPEILAIIRTDPAQRKSDDVTKLKSFYLDNALPEPGKTLRKSWKELEAKLNAARGAMPKVMVMSDDKPRQTFIFSRGNYDSPLAPVTPDTPTALPPMLASLPKNRLGLAKWIVSPENPLTARVEVNRNWQILFGRGLVRTPENFGVQGELPTHPELLDWLAVDFEQHGWDVKRLQKMIVMSSTYRQSSKVSPKLREFDPDNRLLARGARFRMPSMLLRDDALAVSGLLNPTMFGTPVYPYQPKGIWDGLNITDERDFAYPQSKGADLYRRSCYSFWRRTVAPGDLFDASTRQVCTVRMSQTSTPLHALTTLNDVTWVEAGRALAQSVLQSDSTDDARLTDAFRRVCARHPDAEELKILRRVLGRSMQAFKSNPTAAQQYLAQGDSPRDPKLDPVEHAAYATVCVAILNLDEALTRE